LTLSALSAPGNAVYQWESKPAMLKLREKTKAAVFAVRDIGAREAKQRLAEMGRKPVKATRSAKTKAAKK